MACVAPVNNEGRLDERRFVRQFSLAAANALITTNLGELTMSDHAPIKVGQLTIRYLVDASQSGGIGMFELEVPPGSSVPPPHSHSKNEECVYVLEGTLQYSVGTVTRDLKPGETMVTPKGTVHRFSNPFSAVARALVVLSPDIGAQYFRDVGAVVNAGGPPDKGALVTVMSRYGLIPAAPSGA